MTATSVATSGDTSTAAALRLEGVRKTYQVGGGEVVALDCADLAPTTGTVVVGGKDISGYSSRQLTEFRRQSVGFVFQTVNLVPFLTTHENLLVVDEIGPRDGMKSRGTAAVIVTHDDRITHYADRAVRIVDSRVDDTADPGW
jgi:ABC-type lipoprotein export system ATPase subunit